MNFPMARLIAARPTPLSFVAPGPDAGYNPGADYTKPAGQAPATVNCLFHNVEETELIADYAATASVLMAGLPAEIKPKTTRVSVAGQSYTIEKVRARFWNGAQVGWTFYLKA